MDQLDLFTSIGGRWATAGGRYSVVDSDLLMSLFPL